MSSILLNLAAIRGGVSRTGIVAPTATYDSAEDLPFVAETLAKAVGFGRGSKAGHKYWRRVRALVGGKLAWRYYYNTKDDKARYAADRERKRKRDNTRRGIKRTEKQILRREGMTDEHASVKADFLKDHPELAGKRAKLADLNEEYLNGLFNWENAPNINATDAVNTIFGTNVTEEYDGDDPNDLHGKSTHWMRSMEMSIQLVPPEIWAATDGCITDLDFRLGDEDKLLKRKSGVQGYAMNRGGRICIAADRIRLQGGDSTHGPDGGLLHTHVIVHEMHHQIHNRMMEDWGKPLTEGGKSWNDWVGFHGATLAKSVPMKNREATITPYAQTNDKEAFTESASMTLMYPQLMAAKCPKTYEWFRGFYGEAAVRPIETDHKRIAELTAQLDEAHTADERTKLLHLIDMQVGVRDMDSNDPRLEWWNAREKSPLEKMLGNAEAPDYVASSATFSDPVHDDETGQQGHSDRFYEMNYRGRTAHVRIGPGPDDSEWGDIDMTKLRPSNFKEVYDENREPLDPRMMWFHLHQDLFKDPTEVVYVWKDEGKNNVPVTIADVYEHGNLVRGATNTAGLSPTQQAVKAWMDSQTDPHKFLRTLGAGRMSAHDESGNVQLPGYFASYAKWEKNFSARKQKVGEPSKERYQRERELFSARMSMVPDEVTLREYRQHSGTFNYDRIDLAGHEELAELARIGTGPTERLPDGTLVMSSEMSTRRRALLEALAKKQPGLRRRMTRHAKGAVDPDTGKKIGGQFDKSRILVDSDGMPLFERRRWVNTNPDGTQSVFMTARGKDGLHRLEDPMWNALLTPNNEPIESAAHLTELCRRAAAQKKRTWVSVKTDRKRIQKGSKWVMAKAGDVAHYHHFQVEFDGSGQPRVLGSQWAKRTGAPKPRVDDMLQDDPIIGQFRDDARPVLEAEQIRMKSEKKRDPDALPREGETVLLDVEPSELPGNRTTGKTVVARLMRIVKGKDAGVVPSPPNWETMPFGTPEMPEDIGAKKGRLKKVEKEMVKLGLLPPDYAASPGQRQWFETHFQPAYAEWEATKEAETAKFYPTQYIFGGEVGGGAGRKVFRRYGEEKLKATMSMPEVTQVPGRLREDLLAYVHHTVDPRSGASIQKEVRLKLPTDGSFQTKSLEGMPGVDVQYISIGNTKIPEYVKVRLEEFDNFRTAVGGLSLTDEVNDALRERIEMLREADERRRDETHKIELDQIDPAWLADSWGAGLQKQLPNGADFELALHQKELLQKLVDNDGRVLAGHYMGTGKTVSAITAAKMMMVRPDPENPGQLHPDNPKKVLIVAPKNTIEQWRQAAADFDDGALVVGSGANDIPMKDYVGMNPDAQGDMVVVGPEYFTIHQEALKAQGFDGIIIDEVHQGVKNESANRNKAVRSWNPDMKLMMLLTGTPMTTSPADFVEYVRLLSNGKQWADMTTKQFIELYLEPTSIVADLGGAAVGPKIQVKAEKRGELAAILGQWMHIALPKDVKGKVLPATRMEENQHAHMTGVQAMLYNLYMATAGSDIDVSSLADEEQSRLSVDARRAVSAAKAVSNCPAYKPKSDDEYISYEGEVPGKGGKMKKVKLIFKTHDPAWLTDGKARGKAAGKWPMPQELDPMELAVYNLYMTDIMGGSVEELAGKKITAAQLAKLKADGWPRPIDNPDAGPLGIRCRGSARPWVEVQDEKIQRAFDTGDNATAAQLQAEKSARLQGIDDALQFQRSVRHELEANPPDGPWFETLDAVANDYGVSIDQASEWMAVHPVPTVRESFVQTELDGQLHTVSADTHYFSDTTGSLHLLYRPEDVDPKSGKPRSKGGSWADVASGDKVAVPSAVLKSLGIVKPKRPTGMTKAERDAWTAAHADWEPPMFRYQGGDADEHGLVPLVRSDNGNTVFVPTNGLMPIVASLMDPGMRADRVKADIIMTVGNAKTDDLGERISRFHGTGDAGDERQMVLFANGILDGCRTMEAKLRTMGFRDVNETIEGSPHFDPDDPTTAGHQSPNGKYFVTYIGSTYTGDRELNVSIFQKVKDKLGKDSKTSLFVHKSEEPRPRVNVRTTVGGEKATIEVNWMTYKGDHEPQGVRPSQWTPDQRAQIKAQFGIDTPESFVEVEQPDGTIQALNFYGTKKSAKLMREIVLAGDPTKLKDAAEATALRKKIAKLKADYQTEALADIARSTERTGGPPPPPLTIQQQTVFNNCEMIVCSDAAQVGMNLGNAVEMVMYDTLSSPMAEMQRVTRSARMLPPAVKAKLMGEVVMVPEMVDGLDSDGEPTGKKVEAKDADGKTLMVPKVGEDGKIVRTSTGPFGQIRDMEKELFQARERDRKHGTISGMALNSAFPNAKDPEGTETFTQALQRIRVGALDKAEEMKKGSTRKGAKAWEQIAAKAAYAANLGGPVAREMFAELAETRVPGGTDNVITYPAAGVRYEDPEAGTYGAAVSAEPIEAVRAAIAGLSEEDQATIIEAGYASTDQGGVTSADPARIYMAIRAQEILDWVEGMRPQVTAEMRAEEGGSVVTDNDVSNRLIDRLPPEDRAILKTMKYLVNVQKIGVSAHVGQVVNHTYIGQDENGKPAKMKERIHTGYEKEHPVRTERSTRAMQRARHRSLETVLQDVQHGVEYIPPETFASASGQSFSNVSRTGVQKSLFILQLGSK